jgi:hypothetical protein
VEVGRSHSTAGLCKGWRPYVKNKLKAKGLRAQLVQHLPCNYEDYKKKKKKKKEERKRKLKCHTNGQYMKKLNITNN